MRIERERYVVEKYYADLLRETHAYRDDLAKLADVAERYRSTAPRSVYLWALKVALGGVVRRVAESIAAYDRLVPPPSSLRAP